MEDRIKNVMSDVFGIQNNEINDGTSMDTIESWDSLKHLNLIVALEEEFGIRIDDNDTIQLTSFIKIKEILDNYVSQK